MILPAKAPKLSTHKGATWDEILVLWLDGSRLTGWVDTSWGNYVYFQVGKPWKRVSIQEQEVNWDKGVLDLRQQGQ